MYSEIIPKILYLHIWKVFVNNLGLLKEYDVWREFFKPLKDARKPGAD
jgi:hypothetical protein